MTHPQDLGLRAQAAAIRSGELKAAELLDATLARLAERDRALNSTPVVFADEARQMLTDAPEGPLHGVPVTIKDMYALPWRGAHNGTPFELIPAAESGAFRRLRDAGAVIVGVANQHEAGMGTTGVVSAYGMHRNPWNVEHCPGGSSGGSAAAVAARLVAGSVGSDSGGSTRLPAAYCGVVGLKVTYRSLPYDHYFGMGTTFSAPGAFGRDAGDARLVAEALLARSLSAPPARDLRVGIVRDPYWSDCQPEVTALAEKALAATGWTVRELTIDHLELAGAVLMIRLGSEAGCPPAAFLAALSPMTRAIMLSNVLRPAAAVSRADRARAAIRRAVARALDDVDVIAWPTVPTPAPRVDQPFVTVPSGSFPVDVVNMRQAVVGNLTGQPGINIPVGFIDGLPVGLQLLGPWGEEALLLAAAEHVENATGREFVEAVPPSL
ncbi:MAG: aspartyl-tRNA(Asn)/glutamyl-tRNA(Gln) amidotransferase subunit [Acidimicrobiaceae bacterium]|jgi:Asp-tRNA(Asn)/Glu-tRNA(Gln) amidotransferase A subunit family amidase